MMDEVTAYRYLADYREAEGNSAEMQLVCNTALLWLRWGHDQEIRIAQLEQEVEDARQAQFVFMASVTA